LQLLLLSTPFLPLENDGKLNCRAVGNRSERAATPVAGVELINF